MPIGCVLTMPALDKNEVSLLRDCLRQRQAHEDRPLFVFPCGGDERTHPSRRRFRTYLDRNKSESLQNVFCLTAENVSQEGSLADLSLVQQETLLADIADWIVVFAESSGSFCELGIFSALPHASALTTLVLPRSSRGQSSFLVDGPAREIDRGTSPLNRVFYLDLDNPFASVGFSTFVSNLREKVQESLNYPLLRTRKRPNPTGNRRRTFAARAPQPTVAYVGPLVHELLDLLQLLGPLTRDELEEVYLGVKSYRYKRGSLEARSLILSEDMKRGQNETLFTLDQILGMMRATGLVEAENLQTRDGRQTYLHSCVHLESYFMFSAKVNRDKVQDMRAELILRRRRQLNSGVFF